MFGRLAKAVAANPERRVVNGQTRAADLLENHEMVHVPVQDSGGFQAAQLLHLQPQRPPREPQLGGDVHYYGKGGALQRYGVFPAE